MTSIHHYGWFALALFGASSPVFANEGLEAFNTNCLACHKLDSAQIAPSQLEIKQLYPADKEQAFLNWTKSPGKKRPEMIQMPAMAHLSDDNLKQIHQYLLTVKKPKKADNKRHNFSFKPPAPTYPYVRRAYMPFSTPAAIGVVNNKDVGINWDAGIGRMRYVFRNPWGFFSGEKKQQERLKDIRYQETSAQLWSYQQQHKLDFQGYRLKGDLPEFVYQIGNAKIKERISFGVNSVTRHFSCQSQCPAARLDFSHTGNATLSSTQGTWTGYTLSVNTQQVKSFAVTVELQQ